jgi:hypothetical protein
VHDDLDLDPSMMDLHDPIALNQLKDRLQRQGVATLTGVSGRSGALRPARRLITITPHRDSDLDGVTTIVPSATAARRAGFAGFSDRELQPHTEGSALSRPPRVLILICLRPAPVGGDSILVDGWQLYADIARTDPAMLTALSTACSTYFGGEGGYLGSVFTPAPGDRITVRPRLDDLVRFSPAAAPFRARLDRTVERHARVLRLREGEGFAVLNDRWLHGRTRFTGDRAMLRILGDPLPPQAFPVGFEEHDARSSRSPLRDARAAERAPRFSA